MKKYITPSLKVVNIENNAILAGSPSLTADPTQQSTTMHVRGYRSVLSEWDDDED